MATINIRVDENIKREANELLEELGLDMSTAMNLFLRQMINHGGIPFEIRRPNKVTLEAIEEGRRLAADDSVPGYSNVNDLKAALGV